MNPESGYRPDEAQADKTIQVPTKPADQPARPHGPSGLGKAARAAGLAAGILLPKFGQPATAGESTSFEQQSAVAAKTAEKPINLKKLTESSKWSIEIVTGLKNELAKIKPNDYEGREAVIRFSYSKFVTEYYFPTKGKLEDLSHGMKMRKCSDEDWRQLSAAINEMKAIVEKHYEQTVAAASSTKENKEDAEIIYNKRISQLKDMTLKVEIASSPSTKARLEMIDEELGNLKENNK